MIECGLIEKIVSGDDSDPKARIARAAIGEFALRSLDGARIREIAKISGTNVAAISYHFGGKEGLYNAVVAGMSDYFDKIVSPYYEEGAEIRAAENCAAARALAIRFLIDAIRKFSTVKIVPALCLIMSREAASPSEYFQRVYGSIYEKPVEFLARLFITASGGRTEHGEAVVFAQALWSNVRIYSSKSEAILRLHGWRDMGEPEISLLEKSLSKVLEKTLK